jgi:hypothetical protein
LPIDKNSVADQDVYPGSEFFPSRIPDPNLNIPDPGFASKNLSVLTQKMVSSTFDFGGDGNQYCGAKISSDTTSGEPKSELRFRLRLVVQDTLKIIFDFSTGTLGSSSETLTETNEIYRRFTLLPESSSLATMLASLPSMWPRPSITIAFGENPGISEIITSSLYEYPVCEGQTQSKQTTQMLKVVLLSQLSFDLI